MAPTCSHLASPHGLQGYIAPRWLPGGHLQTIWPARLSRPWTGPAPAWRRERWTTNDGDFIDVDFLDAPTRSRHGAEGTLVLFHGLEGSSRGHYSLAFAAAAQRRGLGYAVPHSRGCSGEMNLAPRAYHSGDHAEVGWMLQRLRQRAVGRLWAVGISLGGNALLRWTQEAGHQASACVDAVSAICSPLDLAAAGRAIDTGFNRQVYARMFLATMKAKALAKWRQHPGLFDVERVRKAGTLAAFDDAFTAPLHGYAGVADYWARASALPHMKRLRLPALVVHARNDPFIPASSLPRPADVADGVTLWQPAEGGHVGFASGRPPGHLRALPEAVLDWMAAHGSPGSRPGQ
ncbi:MAG: YheT family hydrolase [Rubrivivax sp.]